ncbi:MAG: hypothetical protein D6800_04335 [Candidatus Zixiibacteriota bacterium]|nr:MAG: hypothetical protein D6800_04335 [candidate division Zixibacteria bacterium]
MSTRQNYLVGGCYVDSLAMLDLLRLGPGKTRVRRQLLRLGDALWLVIDDGTRLSDSLIAVWRTAPGMKVAATEIPGSYVVSADNWPEQIQVTAGGPACRVMKISPEDSSFLGQVAVGLKPVGVNALRLAAPTDKPLMLMAWRSAPAGAKQDGFSATLAPGAETTDWTVRLRLGDRIDSVGRRRDTVTWFRSDAEPVRAILRLSDTAAVHRARAGIQDSFETTGSRYHEFVSLIPYRIGISRLVLLLLFFQEIVLFISRKMRLVPVFRAGAFFGWVAVTMVLLTRYL